MEILKEGESLYSNKFLTNVIHFTEINYFISPQKNKK